MNVKTGISGISTVFLTCMLAIPLLAAETSVSDKRIDVATIYFPGFHRDMHYDAWFGEGWNEWKLLAEAPTRFPGQRLFKPEWGPFDEADPKWMERQIALAADHGINVFIFDWYWYSGVKILYRPLEEGFLKAGNRDRLRYALMWANHSWHNYFPVPLDRPMHQLIPIRHSPEDFKRVMDECIKLHFRQPNYWRVGGGPYFSVFDSDTFVRQLGGPEKTREIINQARKDIEAAGLGRLHLASFSSNPKLIPMLRDAGFDSTTCYNIATSSKAKLPEHPLDDYVDVMEQHEIKWKNMDTGVLPYSPTVTVGWDPSPRWVKETPWPPPGKGYPYGALVINNTPERFGELVRKALKQAESANLRPPAITVNAWNEWTEGGVLLPDVKYKTQFLEELKKALDQK